MTPARPRGPTTALVLGSGGARGWAHLGVIRALRARGVHIDAIVGTSMGALVGGAMASGYEEALYEAARRLDWRQLIYYFLEWSMPRAGLIDGTRVKQFVSRYVQFAEVQDLSCVFRAVATDVRTGQEVVLDRGPLIDAIRASISIPGMFTPVPREGRLLVDGGLVNPVPVSVARTLGCDRVIAVDINHFRLESAEARPVEPPVEPLPAEAPPGNGFERLMASWQKRFGYGAAAGRRKKDGGSKARLLDVLGNSIRIMEAQITESRLALAPADLLIRPELFHFSFMDFHRAEEAVQAGYRATLEALEAAPGQP